MKTKSQKYYLFNLKNVEGQKKFLEITSKIGILSNMFRDENCDIEKATKKFIMNLDDCMHQSFKNIRVKHRENKELARLFNKRRSLRTKSNEHSKRELIKVKSDLADKCAKENYSKIKEELKDIESDEGGMNAGKLWNLKKKLCPRGRDPPAAMLDPNGNLVTSTVGIANLATEHFKKVLENREIKKRS